MAVVWSRGDRRCVACLLLSRVVLACALCSCRFYPAAAIFLFTHRNPFLRVDI